MADVEEKVEYEVEWKGLTASDTYSVADRFRAGANAIGKKDHDRDLETEYNVGKAKEKLG